MTNDKPPFEITELFAFTTRYSEGADEGLMAFMDPRSGTWLPMVAADVARVRSLVPIADQLAGQLGITYRIRRFTAAEDVTEQHRSGREQS